MMETKCYEPSRLDDGELFMEESHDGQWKKLSDFNDLQDRMHKTLTALQYARSVIEALSEKAASKADREYCQRILAEGNSIDAALAECQMEQPLEHRAPRTAETVASEAYQVIGVLCSGLPETSEIVRAQDYFSAIANGHAPIGEILPFSDDWTALHQEQRTSSAIDVTLESDETAAFIADFCTELRRARSLFPGRRIMTIALAEEFGELAKAVLDEPLQNVRKEAIQCAVMAARVAIDGDESTDDWRIAKGLEPIGIKA